MERKTIGEWIFWGAVALAAMVYCLTMSDGMPWRAASSPSRVWDYLVAMAGGSETVLACVSVAVAGGLLGALANRYFGWRVGVAASVIWIFMPGVWNRVLIGARGVVFASAVVVAAWMANAVGLWVLRKARAVRSGGRGATALPGVAHEAYEKYAKVNRIAGWVLLGVAGIFAVVSISLHDYRLGEAASAYARLVVEEAGERIILMNGLCDEQIEREVGRKRFPTALSLHDSDENRAEVLAFVKFAFPSETNLWLEAEVGPVSFAEAAVKAHPDRFYTMMGSSTTPETWAARWEAMKPYLKSRDPFIPAMRRAVAYEGNALGNRLQEEKDAKQAWNLYYRIFTEVHPNNPAACMNLNGMLRRGYKVDAATRQRIESAQADYAKLMTDRLKILRMAKYVSHFGPVMRDEKAYEQWRERVRKRLAELERRGEKPPMTIPDLKTLEEWHSEMMAAFQSEDYAKAARIARAILSRRAWRRFVPANMVLGEKMMMEGKWVLAEAFLRVAAQATGTAAPPPLVLNDYAETLRKLKRLDEAETYARAAIAKTDAKAGWINRLTLAQILRDGKRNPDEVLSLVQEIRHNAPKAAQEIIRREFPR